MTFIWSITNPRLTSSQQVHTGDTWLALRERFQPTLFRRSKEKHSLISVLTNVDAGESQDEVTKVIDHYLVVSTISFSIAFIGRAVFPPMELLCIPGVLYATYPIMKSAWRGIVEERLFGMDALDAIGMPISIFSGYAIAVSLSHMLYFAAKKMLLKTQNRSKTQLVNIMGEQPRFVWVRAENGAEVETAFEALAIGDILIVDAGQTIAVDGLVVEGLAAIDERMLTGESQPVEKQRGDRVLASTIVLQGRVDVRVETAGDQTIAAQIGGILQQTADFKSSSQLRSERIGDQVAMPMVGISALAYVTGGASSAIAVLIAPVVNTLRLASPLSVLGFLQQGLNQGILIKDGRSLELLQEVDTIVFDKTGTLTEDQPEVGAIYLCGALNELDLLYFAAAAEQKQTHPIAKSILAESERRGVRLPPIEEAKVEIGFGLTVQIEQKKVDVGSQRFMALSDVTIPETIQAAQMACNLEGYSLIYVAVDGVLAGAIELHPTIRPEVPAIINELRQRGLTTYIISGDRQEPTRRLAENLGIDHYFAETLPKDKADLIAQLQGQGKKVCFIGDGINDSIALKKANVPISLSGATSVATDTAQVIFMDGTLRQLIPLFDLATDLSQNMNRTVLAAVIPSTMVIGGALFLHLGVYAALGLYYVSLIVGVSNALSAVYKGQRLHDDSSEGDPHAV